MKREWVHWSKSILGCWINCDVSSIIMVMITPAMLFTLLRATYAWPGAKWPDKLTKMLSINNCHTLLLACSKPSASVRGNWRRLMLMRWVPAASWCSVSATAQTAGGLLGLGAYSFYVAVNRSTRLDFYSCSLAQTRMSIMVGNIHDTTVPFVLLVGHHAFQQSLE